MIGIQYCHVVDVALATAGEFARIDDLGKLVKDGMIKREIHNQSGLIRAALRTEFGTAIDAVSFWYTAPFEYPKNETDVYLIKATLAESIGMQEIKLSFTAPEVYSIIGSVSGSIAVGQSTKNDYDANGINILADDWVDAEEAVKGELIYIEGYTIDPILTAICSGLTACALIEIQMRKQALDVEPKLLINATKRYTKMLDDLHDGKLDLGGRNYIDVGQTLSVPIWNISEIGEDDSHYRKLPDPGSGSLGM